MGESGAGEMESKGVYIVNEDSTIINDSDDIDVSADRTGEMIHTLLAVIAGRYPFKFDAVRDFYEHYKSFDLLLKACEYCAESGSGILIMPPDEAGIVYPDNYPGPVVVITGKQDAITSDPKTWK